MALFPSKTIAWYAAKMFVVRTAAFLIGLIIILESLDLLGETPKPQNPVKVIAQACEIGIKQ